MIQAYFIRVSSGQVNFQELQYRSPHEQQQITSDPFFFSYHTQPHPRIPMPVHGFSRDLYPMSFPNSAKLSSSTRTLLPPTTTTSLLQNPPFQSARMMAGNPPLLLNQKDYISYVAEVKKLDDIVNYVPTTMRNDHNISIYMKPNLPDFLRGTTDDVQRSFYQIISNPNESYQQKQSKLDQLILSLSSKNQELYDQYRRRKDMEEREKRGRIHAIVANMSNKAQAVFAKLSAVMMNPTMKDMDRMNKINDFYESVDEDVKNEFKDKMDGLNWQL
ncbi:unnamed protein product [Litomosoides sigmodontis]|uniref:SXP/RAL-2 family protein Ani s 5-like cation-binding domain-containing protein n=1 Tax=Litomosoides sigmodontis TaxID=42156 RepID=A0A3P6T8G0_LITSI|nr:unnamed protein product [Litomosoides sigmodontis]